MRKLFLFLCTIITYPSIAQTLSSEGIFASGDYFSNGFAQLSWTIGDAQTSTLKQPDLVLTQGFLQPNFTVTGINQISDNEEIKVDVFPNPVDDILNLKFSSKTESKLYISLYSLDGKKIYDEKFNTSNNSAEILFTPYQSGYYILKVSSEDQTFLKTYKILFQN